MTPTRTETCWRLRAATLTLGAMMAATTIAGSPSPAAAAEAPDATELGKPMNHLLHARAFFQRHVDVLAAVCVEIVAPVGAEQRQ